MVSIYEAAMAGDLSVVMDMVTMDCQSVHDLDAGGWSALHWAASRGHGLVAAYLVDHGAVIDQQTRHYHSTALYLACEKGHLDMARLLLMKGELATGEGRKNVVVVVVVVVVE